MKKFSTKIIYAFIGTLILSLSGCIDVKQDIWINKDGSGKFIFDVGISKQMKAMMEGFGGLQGLGGEEEESGGNKIPFSDDEVSFHPQGPGEEESGLPSVVTFQLNS